MAEQAVFACAPASIVPKRYSVYAYSRWSTALPALGPEQIETALVPAARRRIVVTRQQLVATMLLMGINRIVVTDRAIRW
jgi:hypothetical protein